MWSKADLLTTVTSTLRDFYKFTLHDKHHALEVDYNLLPLRDSRGFTLYEMSTLKYLPVVIPERNCLKLANNDRASAVQTKSGLYLQKSVENLNHQSEAFFKADSFVLTNDSLYFYNNRDIYKCDLTREDLTAQQIHHSDYDIKEMQVNDNIIHLFTDCGQIVTITDKNITFKSLGIPAEWIKQVKHISAVDNKNFVCYSRNLFKIETDKYQHLYLEFPPITALFFYGDFVIFGTRVGEILLYRLSMQKFKVKPIFGILATLPEDKFAVQLDVCERKSGPVIVIATFFEIMLLEFPFFPQEQEPKTSFPPNKLCMYKRLLKLKERLQNGN